MIRLWCRLFGHRWEFHHALAWEHYSDAPGSVDWCPRCGETRMR